MGQTHNAFAGSIGSGGGRAIVCFAPDGKTIVSAESLDIYEGRVAFGDAHLQTTPRGTEVQVGENKKATVDPSSVDSLLGIAKQRVVSTSYALLTNRGAPEVTKAIDHVRSKLRLVEGDAELKPVDDSLEFLQAPAGCSFSQAAVFLDLENILVDKRIWTNMNAFSKASLIVHEALYWLDRVEEGQIDSRTTRRNVSRIMGEKWLYESVRKNLPKQYLLCQSYPLGKNWRSTVFALYSSAEKTFARLLVVNGQRNLGKTDYYVVGNFPSDLTQDQNLTDIFPIVPTNAEEPQLELTLRINSEDKYEGYPFQHYVTIEGNRKSYPQWTMPKTQLTCPSIRESSSK